MSSATLCSKYVDLDLYNFWCLKLCCNQGVIDESVLRKIMDHLYNQTLDEQIEKHTNFKDKHFKKIIQADFNHFVFPDKICKNTGTNRRRKGSGSDSDSGGRKSSHNANVNANDDVLQDISVHCDVAHANADADSENNLFDPILKPQFIHAVVSAANVPDSDFVHLISENGIQTSQILDLDDTDDNLDDSYSTCTRVFSDELVEDSYDSVLQDHSVLQGNISNSISDSIQSIQTISEISQIVHEIGKKNKAKTVKKVKTVKEVNEQNVGVKEVEGVGEVKKVKKVKKVKEQNVVVNSEVVVECVGEVEVEGVGVNVGVKKVKKVKKVKEQNVGVNNEVEVEVEVEVEGVKEMKKVKKVKKVKEQNVGVKEVEGVKVEVEGSLA